MGAGGPWLVLLGLGSLVGVAAGSTPPGGRGTASYAVIVPRQLAPRAGQDPREVSYLLEVEGRGRVVHLRQKRLFVPEHFALFTYRLGGALQRDQPFVRRDCFYQGYVQGSPASLAALSTCSGGLRGMLRTAQGSYEIEPVPDSATFQHVLYRVEEGAAGLRCGLTDQELQRQAALIPGLGGLLARQAPEDVWWTHTRYVKVVFVVENERFVQSGRNETTVLQQMLDIVNIGDSVYDPLGVRLFLVGLEIWTQNNLIPIKDTINAMLGTFNDWRRNELYQRLPHDAGHLLTYKNFGTALGLAYVGTVCSHHWASAVLSFRAERLYSFSIVFAHELGHNLGMNHDNGDCKCKRSQCIMAAYHSVTDLFSNCSYIYYFNLMTTGAECLLDPPAPEKVYTLKYCGNKVVESGEQCDCGSKFNCEKDPCCQPNCTLSAGAACAFGECCEDCQILPAGRLCRKSTDECDLPEYCNGTSEWCQKDVYVQDGALCQNDAYCYRGNCSSHDRQCKMIFGTQAKVAPLVCFRELNTQGDRFGNCGLNSNTKYKKCQAEDTLCGRVQCENMNRIPSLENHSTILQTPVDNNWCWGTDYHHGMDIADIGAVRDGTSCGPDKICVKMSCVNVSLLNYDCNITKCHNRGICNSHKNCHCNYGWAPPDCQHKGYGGSIDSGPPPPVKALGGSAIGIPIFLAAAAVLGIGLCVYFRTALMGWLRTSVARFHPTQQADASSDGKGVPSRPRETTATVSKPVVESMDKAWDFL
ncbi:disintegrin and metalloproteinase domain-containing protein 20-like [Malaclemys terrapin pileata]|uniref:disintegrin and metalloproteinase domain-containing protein 20-like n=1 Tax=Malaclemys terrapin pileata TaxID=2991368 RepID=UPI0023A83B74|nr:disintegrin and metalloproteinase domain-containing protein 20-like [Malaclemys terrapin pileata]